MTYAESNPLETWVKPMKDESGNFDFTEVDRAQSRNYIQGSKIQMVRVITPSGTSAQEVRLTDGVDDLVINSDGSIQARDFLTKIWKEGTRTYIYSNTTGTKYTCPAGKVAFIKHVSFPAAASQISIKNSGATTMFVLYSPAAALGMETFLKLEAGDYLTFDTAVYTAVEIFEIDA